MSSRREFYLARPEPPSQIKVAALGAALLAVGAGIAAWVSLDPDGFPWPGAQRVVAYLIAACLIVVGLAAPVAAWRQRQRQENTSPALVLDEQGFTTWGGLRVHWTDVTSWEVFHHDATYDDDVPEDHPDYTGPSHVDELLILVHVTNPEAYLRRLDPDVRAAYEDDTLGDDARFGTPIRFGADDLDAPADEVIAEFERYSKAAPR